MVVPERLDVTGGFMIKKTKKWQLQVAKNKFSEVAARHPILKA